MLVPLLGVLAFLAMGVAAFAIVLQLQERDKRQAKERELQIALAENDELKTKLEETQQAKSQVEEELTRAHSELSDSKGQLAKAIEAQEALTRNVEDREHEIERLTKDLDQAKSESKQVASQLTGLQAERQSLSAQLADLEKAKTDLEAKVMELSQHPTVELDKVLVTNGSAPEAAAPQAAVVPASAASRPEGQVVVVNREYDFIVMNLGKHHGLSIGQEFQVVRGSEVLGKVKVEKVYDGLSAAAILPDSKKDAIREGDLVKAL